MLRFSRRRSALWGSGIFLLMFVALNILCHRHAHSMTTYNTRKDGTPAPETMDLKTKLHTALTGVSIPRPESTDTPPAGLQPCETLRLTTQDGATLEAWYSSHGQHAPLVIMFHGYSAEKSSLLSEAIAFKNMGCGVLLVDFRGSGGSSESYTTLGVHEALDVEAAYTYAQATWPGQPIILYGRSMGAAAILRAISVQGVQPRAIILEAVFDRLLNTTKNRFHSMNLPGFPFAEMLLFWGGQEYGFNGFAHNPMAYAASVHCPTLLMHGQDDPRACLQDAEAVFLELAGPKTFFVFPDTAHESYLARAPDLWNRQVESFLTGESLCDPSAI